MRLAEPETGGCEGGLGVGEEQAVWIHGDEREGDGEY